MPEKKPIVILVHGMGEHKPGAFTTQFTDAANAALNEYTGFKRKKIENLVDIEEVNYDSFFDEVRQRMADNQKPIAQRLNGIGALGGLSWGPELVLKLTNIEARFAKDEFLYTHFLDVVFYATLLGGKVRVDVAKKLGSVIEKDPSRKIHIIAHSLGTAVVHDTLALLYRKDFDMNDEIPDLSVVTHKLSSVWMIANVSRLVNCVTQLTDPYSSTVRPTPDGCTTRLFNVRHKLDPFTWLARFDPQDDGSWIPPEYFNRAFRTIETCVIRKLNTHDFGEYIENPKVSVPLLRRLVGLDPQPDEADDVEEDFKKQTIPGAFAELEEALRTIEITDTATLLEFAGAAKHFRDVVKGFQEQIDAI